LAGINFTKGLFMTDEEKENMKLTIENAMLKGFKKFAETMDAKITTGIALHKQSCPFVPSQNSGISLNWFIRNWRTVAVGIMIVSWFMSNLTGRTNKFTSEQVKQIAQQVQEVTNPVPITKNTGDNVQ
jgi:hypothetical protein